MDFIKGRQLGLEWKVEKPVKVKPKKEKKKLVAKKKAPPAAAGKGKADEKKK